MKELLDLLEAARLAIADGDPSDALTYIEQAVEVVGEKTEERDRLKERLSVAEAYIPSRDFGDYQGDARGFG